MRGPWYETLVSLGLPFNLNQSLTFPDLSQLDRACSLLDCPHSNMPHFFFFLDFVGKRRRGLLVRWVEKASLKRIRQLLEIIKAEYNHWLLLLVKNFREIGR